MKLALSLPFAAALLVLSLPGIASAECVAGFADCDGAISQPTTPTFHSTCDDPVMSVGWLDYDVPARTLDLSYSEAMNLGLSVRDEFQVIGPSAGSPVPMRVRLRFAGTACAYGPSPGSGAMVTMSLRLLDPLPGENPAVVPLTIPYSVNCFVSFADSVDLVFTRPASTPFGLEIHGDAKGGYNFSNHAQFVFLDLPPGARATSCKGYLQEQPTPAQSMSWGSVKAAYR
jgi:hypothetical protein